MSLQRLVYDDLGLEIEIESLGAIFKFFKEGEPMYFGQCVVTTGEIQQGVVKGLQGPEMGKAERRKLDTAIRRAMRETNYTQGVFQRKKPGKAVVTVKKDLD